MRRKAGLGGAVRKGPSEDKFSALGRELEGEKLSSVTTTLNSFKDALVEFAKKHRDKINSDAEFRMQFHRMCISMGVDPLASSKGFWSDILGVSDFYFELGVLIIQICVQTRSSNGGLLGMTELLHRVNIQTKAQNKKHAELSDMERAIEKLAILGGGFRVIDIGREAYVISIPMEINREHMDLITFAQTHMHHAISPSLLGWTEQRFSMVITPLLFDGVVWVDTQGSEGMKYEFPTISLSASTAARAEEEELPPPYEDV